MSVFIINFRLVCCLGLLSAGIWTSKAATIVAWGGYSGGSKPGAETNVPPGLTDAIAVALGSAVVIQALLRRIAVVELWTLLPNGVWSVLLFVFSLAWDGVYGD